MRITDQYETTVHTHFVTDGERLREADAHALIHGFGAFLRARGVVFGARLARGPAGAIEVVLECRPATDLAEIRAELAALLEPLPVRPGVLRAARQAVGAAIGKLFGARAADASPDEPAREPGPAK